MALFLYKEANMPVIEENKNPVFVPREDYAQAYDQLTNLKTRLADPGLNPEAKASLATTIGAIERDLVLAGPDTGTFTYPA